MRVRCSWNSTVGLNTSDSSRDYILLYRGDREALSGSLDRIQRASSAILKAVTGVPTIQW